MDATAVILDAPERLALRTLALNPMTAGDVLVEIDWSGVSSGTEKLLWTGRMPSFPGMGYPLVPGYESVGRVAVAGPESGRTVGQRVFVPGSRGFTDVRGLFGGAAARLVSPGARVVPTNLGEDAVLLALAGTAHHAIAGHPPELIVGHGVLGRLLARLTVALRISIDDAAKDARRGAVDVPDMRLGAIIGLADGVGVERVGGQNLRSRLDEFGSDFRDQLGARQVQQIIIAALVLGEIKAPEIILRLQAPILDRRAVRAVLHEDSCCRFRAEGVGRALS